MGVDSLGRRNMSHFWRLKQMILRLVVLTQVGHLMLPGRGTPCFFNVREQPGRSAPLATPYVDLKFETHRRSSLFERTCSPGGQFS